MFLSCDVFLPIWYLPALGQVLSWNLPQSRQFSSWVLWSESAAYFLHFPLHQATQTTNQFTIQRPSFSRLPSEVSRWRQSVLTRCAADVSLYHYAQVVPLHSTTTKQHFLCFYWLNLANREDRRSRIVSWERSLRCATCPIIPSSNSHSLQLLVYLDFSFLSPHPLLHCSSF